MIRTDAGEDKDRTGEIVAAAAPVASINDDADDDEAAAAKGDATAEAENGDAWFEAR